jgi:hypothetical protein
MTRAPASGDDVFVSELSVQTATVLFPVDGACLLQGPAAARLTSADDADRVRINYRQNYDRLARIKRRYDPGNLLRLNQNIAP